jgi:hypothetical protein
MAAMILGGALAEEAKMAPEVGVGFVVFPLAVHSMVGPEVGIEEFRRIFIGILREVNRENCVYFW